VTTSLDNPETGFVNPHPGFVNPKSDVDNPFLADDEAMRVARLSDQEFEKWKYFRELKLRSKAYASTTARWFRAGVPEAKEKATRSRT
jgi:hypothetical protein